jgi:regulator of cell morphogenesis and NO signaling
MESKLIDVTQIAPKNRHNIILGTFENLAAGESFRISNDHNPKPLFYEMREQWGEAVTWEYLINGPELWEVKIGKKAVKEQTIGEIVAADFRKAEVFKKYGIDFCCGGKVTIAEACADKGIDRLLIEMDLKKTAINPIDPSQDFNNWEPAFLCDYIKNTHHKYVLKTLPELVFYTQKIASVHGENHPELYEVVELFESISTELLRHLRKEEEILFPAIKEAFANRQNNQLSGSKNIISSEIERMSTEHEFAGGAMDRINELTKNYLVPDDGCSTYHVTFKMLSQFEDDLHRHVHLENNILYPKALVKETLNNTIVNEKSN